MKRAIFSNYSLTRRLDHFFAADGINALMQVGVCPHDISPPMHSLTHPPTHSLTHPPTHLLNVACPQSQFHWFERHQQRTQVQQEVLREIVDTLKYLINTEQCMKSFIQVDGAIAQIMTAMPQPLERSVSWCNGAGSIFFGIGTNMDSNKFAKPNHHGSTFAPRMCKIKHLCVPVLHVINSVMKKSLKS